MKSKNNRTYRQTINVPGPKWKGATALSDFVKRTNLKITKVNTVNPLSITIEGKRKDIEKSDLYDKKSPLIRVKSPRAKVDIDPKTTKIIGREGNYLNVKETVPGPHDTEETEFYKISIGGKNYKRGK